MARQRHTLGKALILLLLLVFCQFSCFLTFIYAEIFDLSPYGIQFDPLTTFPRGGIASQYPFHLTTAAVNPLAHTNNQFVETHTNVTNDNTTIPEHTQSTQNHTLPLEDTQYAILIDSGSTGSRLSIYHYVPRITTQSIDTCFVPTADQSFSNPNTCSSLPQLHTRSSTAPFTRPATSTDKSQKVTPGLHTILYNSVTTTTTTHDFNYNGIIDDDDDIIVDTTINLTLLRDNIVENLSPLLTFAIQKFIDMGVYHQIPYTPIYLLATGGVRSLANSERAILMHITTQYLRSSGFYMEPGFITTVSGEQEGLYGWVSVNYLLSGGTIFEAKNHNHGFPQDIMKSFSVGDHDRKMGSMKPKPVAVIDLGGATMQIGIPEQVRKKFNRNHGMNEHDVFDLEEGPFLSSYPVQLGDYSANNFIQCFWFYGKDTALYRVHNVLYNILFADDVLRTHTMLQHQMLEKLRYEDEYHAKKTKSGNIDFPEFTVMDQQHQHRPLITSHIHFISDLNNTNNAEHNEKSHRDKQVIEQSNNLFNITYGGRKYKKNIEHEEEPSDNNQLHTPGVDLDEYDKLRQNNTQKSQTSPKNENFSDQEYKDLRNHFIKKQLPYHWKFTNDNGIDDLYERYTINMTKHNYKSHKNIEDHHAFVNTRIFRSPCLPKGYETDFMPYSQFISKTPHLDQNGKEINDTLKHNQNTNPMVFNNILNNDTRVFIVGDGSFDECYQLAKQLIITRTTTPCYNTHSGTGVHDSGDSLNNFFDGNVSPSDIITTKSREDNPTKNETSYGEETVLSADAASFGTFLSDKKTENIDKSAQSEKKLPKQKQYKDPHIFGTNNNVPPSTGSCTSFFGQYRPYYDNSTQFYLFSGFAHIGKLFNLTTTTYHEDFLTNVDDSNPNALKYTTESFNITYLIKMGVDICSKSENELLSLYPTQNKYVLHRYCWFTAYAVAVLHDGMRLPLDSQNLHFVSNVENTDVTYSAGAIVSLLNQLPYYINYNVKRMFDPTSTVIPPYMLQNTDENGIVISEQSLLSQLQQIQQQGLLNPSIIPTQQQQQQNQGNSWGNLLFFVIVLFFIIILLGLFIAYQCFVLRQLQRDAKREKRARTSREADRFGSLGYDNFNQNGTCIHNTDDNRSIGSQSSQFRGMGYQQQAFQQVNLPPGRLSNDGQFHLITTPSFPTLQDNDVNSNSQHNYGRYRHDTPYKSQIQRPGSSGSSGHGSEGYDDFHENSELLRKNDTFNLNVQRNVMFSPENDVDLDDEGFNMMSPPQSRVQQPLNAKHAHNTQNKGHSTRFPPISSSMSVGSYTKYKIHHPSSSQNDGRSQALGPTTGGLVGTNHASTGNIQQLNQIQRKAALNQMKYTQQQRQKGQNNGSLNEKISQDSGKSMHETEVSLGKQSPNIFKFPEKQGLSPQITPTHDNGNGSNGLHQELLIGPLQLQRALPQQVATSGSSTSSSSSNISQRQASTGKYPTSSSNTFSTNGKIIDHDNGVSQQVQPMTPKRKGSGDAKSVMSNYDALLD